MDIASIEGFVCVSRVLTVGLILVEVVAAIQFTAFTRAVASKEE